MRSYGFLAFPFAVLGLVAAACSTSARPSFDSDAGAGTAARGSDGGLGSSGLIPSDAAACTALECDIPTDCPSGATTTLRGKVYDPAGVNPLYNVQVYIPSGLEPEKLPPLKSSLSDGVECSSCASTVINPLRSTLTDPTGEFVLKDIPVAGELPLVIQVGKWRRLLKVDASKKCTENVVPNGSLRLPRNGKEGDMPHIAVASGGADALECLIRGIGVDATEFVMGAASSGHIHMFRGLGGGMGADGSTLWSTAAQLQRYDLVLLSCEGTEVVSGRNLDAMYDYLNAGGKAFATHFHYTWFRKSSHQEFKDVASWTTSSNALAGTYTVNQSFPKGADFAKWLQAVGATTKLGQINLDEVRSSVSGVGSSASAWVQDSDSVPKYFSFNTPVGAAAEQQCGRAVFSDIHIVKLPSATSPPSLDFCPIQAGKLNPQQKALEFLFFDLSACVSDDKTAPQPPK